MRILAIDFSGNTTTGIFFIDEASEELDNESRCSFASREWEEHAEFIFISY